MKKFLICVVIATLLTGCSNELTPEQVTRGVKNTYTDIGDIQPIPLHTPENGNGIQCPNTDNKTWVVFRLKNNETYLAAVGTANRVGTKSTPESYTYTICYKQKLF